MRVTITGAAGMLGRKLTASLIESNEQGISALDLHDIVPAQKPDTDIPTRCLSGSIADQTQIDALAASRPDLIFHLAAIVSGEAERDFDKGWSINLHANLMLLEALRKEHLASGGYYRPKIIFSSSIAVFGGPYPDAIDDSFLCAPLSSYGTQKAMAELALADYSRKGFVDGLSLRMPTVAVRPGAANAAASSFFSGIIREPLAGLPAQLPVADTLRHWFVSPRTAVSFLRQAAELDFDTLGGRRSLNLPGVSCTVAQQIEALVRVAGAETANLINYSPDPEIEALVSQWPQNFDASRALAMGFTADADFDSIIRVYLEDDCNLQRTS